MDERKVKRVYHPLAVPAADLFKGGKQRRVAAYARVSTASDAQLNSVEAQKAYFAKLIHQRPDWIFVGVYADEGITSTSINRREAFNRMVTDALAGNIDLIVTKSTNQATYLVKVSRCEPNFRFKSVLRNFFYILVMHIHRKSNLLFLLRKRKKAHWLIRTIYVIHNSQKISGRAFHI